MKRYSAAAGLSLLLLCLGLAHVKGAAAMQRLAAPAPSASTPSLYEQGKAAVDRKRYREAS